MKKFQLANMTFDSALIYLFGYFGILVGCFFLLVNGLVAIALIMFPTNRYPHLQCARPQPTSLSV